jgi:hypothetical protein
MRQGKIGNRALHPTYFGNVVAPFDSKCAVDGRDGWF